MIIDFHTHLGRIFPNRSLSAEQLVDMMNKNGIDKAVVLPIENPEETFFYYLTFQVLEDFKKFPDRIIPFCNVDPRRGPSKPDTNYKQLIEEYVKLGCRGFGEMLAGLPINDARLKSIYKVCGEFGLPVILHIGTQGGYDDKGLPFLEEILKEFPDVNFCGHAQYFWSEISAEVDAKTRGGYPKNIPIKPGGRVDELMSKYPNLYGDMSAGSGFNAISRDIEYGKYFMLKHHKQLLFATDFLHTLQENPIIGFMKEIDLPKDVKEHIYYKNAERIMRP